MAKRQKKAKAAPEPPREYVSNMEIHGYMGEAEQFLRKCEERLHIISLTAAAGFVGEDEAKAMKEFVRVAVTQAKDARSAVEFVRKRLNRCSASALWEIVDEEAA